MPPPSPKLHRLASEREYWRIPYHLKCYPQDVMWRDHYGSTVLHSLCLTQSVNQMLLDAVDAVLEVAPYLAGQPNHASWTPLHLACETRLLWRSTPAATTAMARINQDHSYHTPYQYQNQNQNQYQNDNPQHQQQQQQQQHQHTNEEILILKLLHACPEAVSMPLTSGFKAKTPFHIACENNASYEILKQMLQINPSLATQPSVRKQDRYSVSDTPLVELWNVLCKHIDDDDDEDDDDDDGGEVGNNHFNNNNNNNGNEQQENGHNHTARQNNYEGNTDNNVDDPSDLSKMELLLKAAYAGNVNVEESKFHILCAACSVKCPRDYITLLIRRYPHLIRQPDPEYGLLPLHYAVKSALPESSHYTDFLLEELLTAYPEAAAIAMPTHYYYYLHHRFYCDYNKPFNDSDKAGIAADRTVQKQQILTNVSLRFSSTSSPPLLALHVLVADRKCTRQGGGIMRLIQAYPESLQIPDPRSGLVPVLASAEVAIQSRIHLTTTYELLRAAPDVIQPIQTS